MTPRLRARRRLATGAVTLFLWAGSSLVGGCAGADASSTTNTGDEVGDRRPGTSEQDGTTGTIVMADDIPVAKTPDCGWETCTESQVNLAPDLRGA